VTSERVTGVLLEDDLRGALAEQSKPAVSALDHRAHRLADRVERVDFVDLVLGEFITHCLVVLAEVQQEAEQCALRLVTDLLRQVALVLCRLRTQTHTGA